MDTLTHLNIMGTRGVPASHGGFETFAERLALFLVARGVSVTVYCQSEQGCDLRGREDNWNGINRVHFGTKRAGCVGAVEFDLACVRHVLNRSGVDLVLGYNTAVFNLLQRAKGRQVFMNVDGIEWQRSKWSLPVKLWFLNGAPATKEFMACNITGKHVTLTALCEVCETVVSKPIAEARIPEIARTLDLTIKRHEKTL